MKCSLKCLLTALIATPLIAAAGDKPNILFIFSDDHALNAISAYGGRLEKVAPTPHIDRLANEGALFHNSFCTNSICGPSRASILTGKHSHKNGFLRNTGRGLDQSQWTLSKALKEIGYQTVLIGKWHLINKPIGFDHWEILPGQGRYYNPEFVQMDGTTKQFTGYVTDITTDKALKWLDSRDKSKPFFLMCQHKAPHRTFSPAFRHLKAFEGVQIPEPETLFDDYANRSTTLAKNEMEIDRHFYWDYDLKIRKEEQGDVKLPTNPNMYPLSISIPEYQRMNPEQKAKWDAHFGPLNQKFLADVKAGKLSHQDIVRWKYQRYMRNYLGTVKAVDESVGRLLKYLDDNDLKKNTIVIYSSDQGFFLGEHGWYDKRWMFEESFKMPFVIRWPGVIKPGSKPSALIQNIDYAPTFMDIAGSSSPAEVQGLSILPILKGEKAKVRDAVYYGYYERGEHNVPQHFGVRTQRFKLIHFPGEDEWNMFDLEKDPQELVNVYGHQDYVAHQKSMHEEYQRLRKHYDAPEYHTHMPNLKKKSQSP